MYGNRVNHEQSVHVRNNLLLPFITGNPVLCIYQLQACGFCGWRIFISSCLRHGYWLFLLFRNIFCYWIFKKWLLVSWESLFTFVHSMNKDYQDTHLVSFTPMYDQIWGTTWASEQNYYSFWEYFLQKLCHKISSISFWKCMLSSGYFQN